jgi:branched-chain amino acid transport system ATP-binding protein
MTAFGARPGGNELDAGPCVREPLLELVNVHAGYGSIEVLHGVSLWVPTGGLVALLGPNGGGKSTTLRVCCGLLSVTSGDFRLGGRVVNGAAAHDLARLGVCTIPEGRGVFPNLSVRENLWLVTRAGVARDKVETTAFERFPVLAQRPNQLAGTLSGGEQQMLSIARALATDPVLLILDELSMGLAPIIVTGLYETVAELAQSGLSILVAEQFAQTVLPIAQVAAIMVHGQIVCAGDPASVEEELATAYLGG